MNQTTHQSNGCWTCKLRRKKCDGNLPTCTTCAGLHITCFQGQARPEWMDGGARQEQMAEDLKCMVKENAHRRRGEHSVNIFPAQTATGEATQGNANPVTLQPSSGDQNASPSMFAAPADVSVNSTTPSSQTATSASPNSDCRLGSTTSYWANKQLGRSEVLLISFYQENLFPFLFPFHQPAGGKAWILELMLWSPVVRQATLCQSSYYLSLAQETADHHSAWEEVLSQTREAFGVLNAALQVINGDGIAAHLHGAVRILTGIMQLQRFEVAVMSFDNCQAHLNAAVALFRQLLGSESEKYFHMACARSSYDGILNRLEPSSPAFSSHSVQAASAEHAAFRFSSALLVLEDIIASTMLQEPPRLYEYHNSLLVNKFDSTGSAIDLGSAMGCENWIMLQIGQIAALDAWKQSSKRAGNLDMMQLVERATPIKNALESNLAWNETNSVSTPQHGKSSGLLGAFQTQPQVSEQQRYLITQVWAHAAIAYLFVVVSGWQPASADIQYHAGRIIDLLSEISPPSLLRTMVWPFCVAGCLAEPAQELRMRGFAQALQPSSVFGTVNKALRIMEDTWSRRGVCAGDRDLATCFRSQGELVLLI